MGTGGLGEVESARMGRWGEEGEYGPGVREVAEAVGGGGECDWD